MTTVPPVTTPTANNAAGASSGGAVLSSDFQTFLTMLTTQLQYQDPLNPVESSDFAVQLATFSGVEQQVMTNDLLTAMTSQMTTAGMAEMAAWVGKEARAPALAYFDGSPITVAPNPAVVADHVEMVVHDEAGAEIQRIALPVSAEPIEWAGVTTDGSPLPNGTYSFEVISYDGEGTVLLQENADVYATVVEVRSEGGVAVLIMEGGVAVPASTVSALRDPT